MSGACTDTTQHKPEDVRTVRVITVGALAGSRSAEYAGEIRPRHEIRLAFRVAGKITERLVEVGDAVKAGAVIARLDPSDLVLAARNAQAQAQALESERALAASELKRYAELRAKNFISQAEYDRRSSTLATADARLEAARAQALQAANQARYAALVTDTEGVITAVAAEAGHVVVSGQTVAWLARPGEKEVVFAVPESQRESVRKAGRVDVTLNARPGGSWSARLRELAPAADPNTRLYAARATIIGSGEGVDLGMSARATVLLEPPEKRIEIPLLALHSRGDTVQVFVVERGATVQLRTVKTAGFAGERVVVESGLSPGEVVVAAGAQFLRPGQKVRVLRER
jgi:RND family efflux transporter MFP subunit